MANEKGQKGKQLLTKTTHETKDIAARTTQKKTGSVQSGAPQG